VSGPGVSLSQEEGRVMLWFECQLCLLGLMMADSLKQNPVFLRNMEKDGVQ